MTSRGMHFRVRKETEFHRYYLGDFDTKGYGYVVSYNDVGVKTINKFNPIPYSTLKNSYFVVYRRGLGNI